MGANPAREKQWAEAKKRYRLSVRHVQMARALGMNPRKLGHVAANPSEPWKTPLREFIEECYEKRFGSRDPAAL